MIECPDLPQLNANPLNCLSPSGSTLAQLPYIQTPPNFLNASRDLIPPLTFNLRIQYPSDDMTILPPQHMSIQTHTIHLSQLIQ